MRKKWHLATSHIITIFLIITLAVSQRAMGSLSRELRLTNLGRLFSITWWAWCWCWCWWFWCWRWSASPSASSWMQSPAGREQPLLAAGSVSHLPISGKPFTMHHQSWLWWWSWWLWYKRRWRIAHLPISGKPFWSSSASSWLRWLRWWWSSASRWWQCWWRRIPWPPSWQPPPNQACSSRFWCTQRNIPCRSFSQLSRSFFACPSEIDDDDDDLDIDGDDDAMQRNNHNHNHNHRNHCHNHHHHQDHPPAALDVPYH